LKDRSVVSLKVRRRCAKKSILNQVNRLNICGVAGALWVSPTGGWRGNKTFEIPIFRDFNKTMKLAIRPN
jgi:hypothetical protein